jgi:hypothetical protein
LLLILISLSLSHLSFPPPRSSRTSEKLLETSRSPWICKYFAEVSKDTITRILDTSSYPGYKIRIQIFIPCIHEKMLYPLHQISYPGYLLSNPAENESCKLGYPRFSHAYPRVSRDTVTHHFGYGGWVHNL